MPTNCAAFSFVRVYRERKKERECVLPQVLFPKKDGEHNTEDKVLVGKSVLVVVQQCTEGLVHGVDGRCAHDGCD